MLREIREQKPKEMQKIKIGLTKKMKGRTTRGTDRESGWVTDEEEEKEDKARRNSGGSSSKRMDDKSAAWWRRVILTLPRMRVRSEEMPRIGQQCVVMTGKAGDDAGQVAVVTVRKRCMVEIAYVGAKGDIRRKLKRPGTLLFLRKGVTVVQDEAGAVWVQPEMG
jgi:hypothetical protein